MFRFAAQILPLKKDNYFFYKIYPYKGTKLISIIGRTAKSIHLKVSNNAIPLRSEHRYTTIHMDCPPPPSGTYANKEL